MLTARPHLRSFRLLLARLSFALIAELQDCGSHLTMRRAITSAGRVRSGGRALVVPDNRPMPSYRSLRDSVGTMKAAKDSPSEMACLGMESLGLGDTDG